MLFQPTFGIEQLVRPHAVRKLVNLFAFKGTKRLAFKWKHASALNA